MTLLGLLLLLILIGVGLYVLNATVPMDPRIRTLITAVVCLVALLMVANFFGVFAAFDRPHYLYRIH